MNRAQNAAAPTSFIRRSPCCTNNSKEMHRICQQLIPLWQQNTLQTSTSMHDIFIDRLKHKLNPKNAHCNKILSFYIHANPEKLGEVPDRTTR